MRSSIFTLFLSTLSIFTYAQSNTEVHLFDIQKKDGKIHLTNHINVSNNEGYDNQPSFWDDTTLLYAATRNGQTDILKYDIDTKASTWITDTPNGNEYSPTRILQQQKISAIRLDDNGRQFLYSYHPKKGTSTPIDQQLVIGYHTWITPNQLVSFVLGDSSSLVVSDLKKQQHDTIAQNIGRSLHKIPNTELVSYIDKSKEQWEIRSLNPKTKETQQLITTLPEVEDMCWTPDGTILMAKGQMILSYTPKKDQNWSSYAFILDKNIQNITRMAVNPSGTKLALVAEVSPEGIVQQQLEAYNNRDIDAFLKTYSKDVKVYNFPNTLNYQGKKTMKSAYEGFFKNTPDLHCKIIKRIVQGNKVIDEEMVTANGATFGATAIYEVVNGKIAKVTFIR